MWVPGKHPLFDHGTDYGAGRRLAPPQIPRPQRRTPYTVPFTSAKKDAVKAPEWSQKSPHAAGFFGMAGAN